MESNSHSRRMEAVQADIISELNESIRQANTRYNRLEAESAQAKQDARFYKALQDVIKRSPMLQGSWDNFLVQLKMVATEDEMKKLDPTKKKQ